MKKLLATASLMAGAALIVAPASAQARGTVGATFGHDDARDTETIGVEGGLTFPAGGNLVVLLDGAYTTEDDLDTDTLTGDAHLITRNSQRAIGGFVGFSNIEVGPLDLDSLTVGGEYAKFMPNATLALSLSYENFDDIDTDIIALGGEYRIFSSDNLRFDLGAGYLSTDGGLVDDDTIRIAAGAEYRFAGTPFSLGGRVAHTDGDGPDDDFIGATLRYDFGLGSLKDRDRRGNTFGSLGGLTSFIP